MPVCTGVVIAEENKDLLIDAWTKFNEEQRRKQETKMEKLVLDLWRKFVMGLRIREKVNDTYGDGVALPSHTQGMRSDQPITLDDDEDNENNGVTGAPLPFADEDNFGGGFLLDDDENQPIPEDLEMEHHNEIPKKADPKGKERATDEYGYPTPSSVSPLKPAVRRQRKSLLREPSESDDEISELSSVPDNDDMDGALDTFEDDSYDIETIQRRPNARKTARVIEVAIPSSTKRRSNKPAVPSPPSNDRMDEDDSSDPEVSSDDNNLDTEDDYQPTKTSARKATQKPPARGTTRSTNKKSGNQSTVAPSARSRRSQVKREDEDDDENGDEIVTPQRKRTPRRTLRRDSTIVTSPYFE